MKEKERKKKQLPAHRKRESNPGRPDGGEKKEGKRGKNSCRADK